MANIMPSGMDYPRGLRGAIAKGHHKIGGTTLADCKIYIAKLSHSFSFSWAEMVYNLGFPPPHQPRKVRK